MILTRYNLKEYWRHGEAASVNLEAVNKEHVRVAKRLILLAIRSHMSPTSPLMFSLSMPELFEE